MTLSIDWIVGFVDGEGCFSFSLIRNDKLRFGYQIQGEFTVVQHKRDIQLLYKLKEYFKCGVVAVNHGDRYHYRVKNLTHNLEIILPFFETHCFKTIKKFQLPVFKEICLRLKNKQHFTKEGFEEIKILVKKLSDLKKS
jgi:LAGLIDADG endonuclease